MVVSLEVLIPVDVVTGKPNEEKSVYESLLAVEYIDAIANPLDECHRLLPRRFSTDRREGTT